MEQTTTLIRKCKEDPFARVPKTVLEDENLSWKAKGLLSYLLGKPDDWKVWVGDLVNRGSDGEAAVRSGLKELRDAHYAKLDPVRDSAGHITGWLFTVSDTPDLPVETWHRNGQEKPDCGTQGMACPSLGMRDPTKKEGTETESDREGRDPVPPRPQPELPQATIAKSSPKPKPVPTLPREVQVWNQQRNLPKVQAVTNGRLRALTARRREQYWVDNFEEAVRRVLRSDFCTGKNDRGWRANFDWLLRPDTIAKVMEGRYDNHARVGGADF